MMNALLLPTWLRLQLVMWLLQCLMTPLLLRSSVPWNSGLDMCRPELQIHCLLSLASLVHWCVIPRWALLLSELLVVRVRCSGFVVKVWVVPRRLLSPMLDVVWLRHPVMDVQDGKHLMQNLLTRLDANAQLSMPETSASLPSVILLRRSWHVSVVLCAALQDLLSMHPGEP